jgi:hypothetical protein
MPRHKHHDAIVAWAEGKPIEYRASADRWLPADRPLWADHVEYRVAPEKKAPRRLYLWAYRSGAAWYESYSFFETEDQVRKATGAQELRRLDHTFLDVED